MVGRVEGWEVEGRERRTQVDGSGGKRWEGIRD